MVLTSNSMEESLVSLPWLADSTTPLTESTIRQADGFVSLVASILMAPFKRALVAFIVICQLPFARQERFIDFCLLFRPEIDMWIPCYMMIKT
jgi:hypothetical protein